MDTYLAIASKRDCRNFADRPIPDEVVQRILDAGRLAGSASNKQPWRFVVAESPDVRERVAETVYAPANVRGAALVVALVGPSGEMAGFDAGRAVQNMFLAAWNDGVASVPNGMQDADRTAEALALGGDERPRIVLAFGYPRGGSTPSRVPRGSGAPPRTESRSTSSSSACRSRRASPGGLPFGRARAHNVATSVFPRGR